MLSYTLAAAGIIMLTSFVGVLFISRASEGWLQKHLSYLVAFSAGVFLMTGAAITYEVLHIFEEWWLAGLGVILLGYLIGAGADALIPDAHHHHDPGAHDHHHGRKSASRIIVGDGLHNVADGLMLLATFAVSPVLGVAVTVSILIHETLQEISEFFVLKEAGFSTARAIMINAVVSATILIGVLIGFVAIDIPYLEGLLLALSAGILFHVVFHDLFPHPKHHETRRSFLTHFTVLVAGLLLMVAIQQVFGDAHEHEQEAAGPLPTVGEPDHHDHH